MPLTLKRFTLFAYGHDNTAPEVWVNPLHVAHVQPRIVTRGHAECTDGTRLFFTEEGGVVDVREPIGQVVATLMSGQGGICRDCYAPLPHAWMSMCDDCRAHRHNGVDELVEQSA